MTEVDEQKEVQGAALSFGYVHVNKQPKLYKKIRERSYENIGYGPITLSAFEYDTTGFSLLPPTIWRDDMATRDKRYRDAALYGLSYILKHVAPGLCMADIKDIETDVSLHEEAALQWKSSLYLYDAHEGGVGYAEKIFELITEALSLCRLILNECECPAGCPSCVPPLPPGVNDEELEDFLVESNAAVQCTHSLLVMLLDGKIVMPDITIFRESRQSAITAPPLDEDAVKLQNRLEKASAILSRKRERQH